MSTKETILLSYKFGIKDDFNYQTPEKYPHFRQHIVDGFKGIIEENAARIIPDKDVIYTIQISTHRKPQNDKVSVSKDKGK